MKSLRNQTAWGRDNVEKQSPPVINFQQKKRLDERNVEPGFLEFFGRFLCLLCVAQGIFLMSLHLLPVHLLSDNSFEINAQPLSFPLGVFLLLLAIGFLQILKKKYFFAFSIAVPIFALCLYSIFDYFSSDYSNIRRIINSYSVFPVRVVSEEIYFANIMCIAASAMSLALYSLPIRNMIRTPFVSLIGLGLFSYGTMGLFWANAGVTLDLGDVLVSQLNAYSFMGYISMGALIIVISYALFERQKLAVNDLWYSILGYTALSTVLLAVTIALFVTVPTYGLLQKMVRNNLSVTAQSQSTAIEQYLNFISAEARHYRSLIERYNSFSDQEGDSNNKLPAGLSILPDTMIAYAFQSIQNNKSQFFGKNKKLFQSIIETTTKNKKSIQGPFRLDDEYFLAVKLEATKFSELQGEHIFFISLTKAERVFMNYGEIHEAKASYLVNNSEEDFHIFRFSNKREEFYLVDTDSQSELYHNFKELIANNSSSTATIKHGNKYYSIDKIPGASFYVIVTDSAAQLYERSDSLVVPTFYGALALGLLTSLGIFALMYLMRNKAVELRGQALEESHKNNAILARAPTGIIILEADGTIESINPRMLKKLGSNNNLHSGKNIDGLFYRPFDDADSSYEPEESLSLDEILAIQGQNTSIDLRLKVSGGEFLPCSCSFSKLDLETGERYLAFVINLSEQIERNKKIKESLVEKNILLNEIHHRVKNNLQVIASLLRLQARRIEDPGLISVFEDSRNRVQSIALLHQVLYESGDLGKIDLNKYFSQLLSHLFQSYGVGDNLEYQIDTNDIHLSIEVALPCGLLVNEIVTNAIKHAFKENNQGKIIISLDKEGEEYQLRVSDNGSGFSETSSSEANTLGTKLIRSFVSQLDGSMSIDSKEGTEYRIQFSD